LKQLFKYANALYNHRRNSVSKIFPLTPFHC